MRASLKAVRDRVASIEKKSPRLGTPYGNTPSKGGDGGDDVLWNGLLASTGYKAGFFQVMNSQASASEKRPGMWYRNPLRRSNDNAGHEWFFSRDMAMGVLLALASYDYGYLEERALLWLRYIDKNRACSVKKPRWMGGGCLIRSPFYRYSPDADRGNITPVMWAMMGRVWDRKNWARNSSMSGLKGSDGDVCILSAKTVPLGYQLHLLAVQAYLKMVLGQSRSMRKKVARICHERQPDNLFYKIVYQETAYEEDFLKFLELCPDPHTFKPADYWLWEKSVQDPRYSCGWDWVFVGRMMMQSTLNRR